MFEHFSQEALKVVMYAQEEARRAYMSMVEPEHVLLGLLKDSELLAHQVLRSKGVDFEAIKTHLKPQETPKKGRVMEIHFSDEASKVFELAEAEAEHFQHGPVDSDHLLLGLIELGDQRCLKALENAGAHIQHLRWNILRLRYFKRNAEIRTVNLKRYSQDLTQALESHNLPSVLEWRPMVERVIQYLNMERKHSVLLVGEQGVGKTALIHAVNQYILSSRIYKRFSHYRLVHLHVDKMLAEAGTDENLFEMTTSMIGEIRQSEDIILVIENIHHLFLANKKEMEFVIAQPLLALLEDPKTHCIATTHPQSLATLKERTQLMHFFHALEVPEPPPEFCLDILHHWKHRIESHHGVSLRSETLHQTVVASGRQSGSQNQPEAALSLLDLSASHKVWQWNAARQEYRETERSLRQLIEQRSLIAPEVEGNENIRKAFEHIKAQIYQAEERLYELKPIIDTETPELTPADILPHLHPLSHGH